MNSNSLSDEYSPLRVTIRFMPEKRENRDAVTIQDLGNNKLFSIAPDFQPYSRNGKRRIAGLCNSFRDEEDG